MNAIIFSQQVQVHRDDQEQNLKREKDIVYLLKKKFSKIPNDVQNIIDDFLCRTFDERVAVNCFNRWEHYLKIDWTLTYKEQFEVCSSCFESYCICEDYIPIRNRENYLEQHKKEKRQYKRKKIYRPLCI